VIEGGEKIFSETRLFDASNGKTYGLRTKEELNDYRYFPDPDLSPMVVSEEWLKNIEASMPELPRTLVEKYVKHFQLPAYDAAVITESRELATYFEEVCKVCDNYKGVSNWIMGPLKSSLNELNLTADEFPVKPGTLAQLVNLVDSGSVSYTVASQRLFAELLKNPLKSPLELAQQLNLLQDSNLDSIMPIVEEVIKEFPLKVEEYKKGKKGIVSMFMGEVMKRSKGKADPKMASDLISKKLEEVK
jgi:aspartyl-tRNA(Asn)/glutamyl-tRNA(Gln) amidotransferase subunit B